jgi:hypothetical protein
MCAALSQSGSHGLYSHCAEGEGWKYEYMITSKNHESTHQRGHDKNVMEIPIVRMGGAD